jgi:hypothetical protein
MDVMSSRAENHPSEVIKMSMVRWTWSFFCFILHMRRWSLQCRGYNLGILKNNKANINWKNIRPFKVCTLLKLRTTQLHSCQFMHYMFLRMKYFPVLPFKTNDICLVLSSQPHRICLISITVLHERLKHMRYWYGEVIMISDTVYL